MALAQPGAQAGIPFLTPDRPGVARMVRGETYRLENIDFITPHDGNREAAAVAPFDFFSYPAPIRFPEIQRLIFHPLASMWMGSAPDRMECYALSNARRAIPPPPNWQRMIDQIPPWERPQPLTMVDHLPYLDHAVYCWAPDAETTDGESGARIYLFRQGFSIQDPDRFVRAVLRITSNAELLEATFNEYPLHTANTREAMLAEFEVTPLIQSGVNILALKLRERPRSLEPGYGVAFHLELVQQEQPLQPPPVADGSALLLGKNGDRLWGAVEQIQGESLRIVTPYGPFNQEWTETSALLFPAGWREPVQPRSWLHRLRGGAPERGPVHYWGLPLDIQPTPPQDSLLMTEGRVTTANPSYVQDNKLFFEGKEGRQYSAPLGEVLGIYPPRPISWTFRRPHREDAILYCHVTATNGDRISGLLRELNGRRLVLESEGGNILRIKPDWISTIDFPYHSAPGRNNNRLIALLAQAAGQEAYRPAYLEDARQVQGAAFSIGATLENLGLQALAAPDQLTPQRYPMLITIDPVGEYPYTIETEGDAQKALADYVDRGGVLLALSRGGAFRTALLSAPTGFTRSAAETRKPNLLDMLGLATRRPDPDTAATEALRPFNHPGNAASGIVFQRNSEVPEGLLGLPRQITLGPLMSARFYPMVSTNGAGTVVYELLDESGQHYGPALSLVPRGRGMVVVIDHLLWNSQVEGRPFSERVLPLLLRWGLDTAFLP